MKVLLLTLSFGLLPSWEHDFHTSITTVEYSAESQTLQTTLKLFTDDLENALKKRSGKDTKLGTTDELTVADSLIKDYIADKFAIRQSGGNLLLTWVGKEVKYNITFVYVSFRVAKKPHKLDVTNTLFFELFDDQNNIVNIEIGEQLESAFLTHEDTNQKLSFKNL